MDTKHAAADEASVALNRSISPNNDSNWLSDNVSTKLAPDQCLSKIDPPGQHFHPTELSNSQRKSFSSQKPPWCAFSMLAQIKVRLNMSEQTCEPTRYIDVIMSAVSPGTKSKRTVRFRPDKILASYFLKSRWGGEIVSITERQWREAPCHRSSCAVCSL